MTKKIEKISVDIEIDKDYLTNATPGVKAWFRQVKKRGLDLYLAITASSMSEDVSCYIENERIDNLIALWYSLDKLEEYIITFLDDEVHLSALGKLDITGHRPNYKFYRLDGNNASEDIMLFNDKEEAEAVKKYIQTTPYFKDIASSVKVLKVINNEIQY